LARLGVAHFAPFRPRAGAGEKGKGQPVERMAWLVLSGVLAALACTSGPSPSSMCLGVSASPKLNLYENEPHVVVLKFYPLQNAAPFQAADAQDLVKGKKPAGMTGDPWEATVLPGQSVDFTEQLPRDTADVGIVADFFSGASRAVVPAKCGMFGKPKIVLSASDVQVAN
jgi:type VI secretion system VasD/TssJ family lipoprotein